MTRRLAILAQFDPQGGVPAHVRLHLQGLRPVVERLVLVSNSPIAPSAARETSRICDRIIERENVGWDFGAWRDALATEDVAPFDWVILTNSSIIGPLYPLEPIFERMEAGEPDIWGMVLSRNKGKHLQSYFLSASAQVTASITWKRFWRSVQDHKDKKKVIRQYEIGFSRTMISAGFDLIPLIPELQFPDSVKMVNIERFNGKLKVPFSANRINRTVEFHSDLIKMGMPYLKSSLIMGKDIYRFSGTDEIISIIGSNFPIEQLI